MLSILTRPSVLISVILTSLVADHNATSLTIAGSKDGTSETLATQWRLAAGPAVKLSIREEAWYRVEQPHLLAAGLAPEVDPRTLQLFVDGMEQRIHVLGEQDGTLDPEDAIEFYGVGQDTAWSDARTYWLVAGLERGKRVRKDREQRATNKIRTSFPFTVELKERLFYSAAVKNGDKENWFGAMITTERPIEQSLILYHLDSSASEEVLLDVEVQGLTLGPHNIRIELNGAEVGAVIFKDRKLGVARLSFSHSLLRDGANQLMLVAQGDELDTSLVDALRLTYRRTYSAYDDFLRFTAGEQDQVNVAGFSRSELRLIDITDPANVQELLGDITQKVSGFAIALPYPGPRDRTFLAFSETRVRQPAAIERNEPSAWHNSNHQADILIVTHETFGNSIEPLRIWRDQQGWAVEVIDVQDIYDEFNFGTKSPYAIRELVSHTIEKWASPPRFLLLVGDATWDPRNYRGLGDFDFVPSKEVETQAMETVSDDWFADLESDGVPELAVGRIAVRTVEEAETVIRKIIRYEQIATLPLSSRGPDEEGWVDRVLIVADNAVGPDFEAASIAIEDLLPINLNIDRVFLGQSDLATAKSELLAYLNKGQVLVNFIGHGSVKIWSKKGLLTLSDASKLRNGPRMPLVVAMNCLNGLFHTIHTDSLAEVLQKTDKGGAVAVWASSGLTSAGSQAKMNQALVRALFQGDSTTIGEAIVAAKTAINGADVRRTWILFGDPVMRLKRTISEKKKPSRRR